MHSGCAFLMPSTDILAVEIFNFFGPTLVDYIHKIHFKRFFDDISEW